MEVATEISELKSLVRDHDSRFWHGLAEATRASMRLDQLLVLSSLRKRAMSKGIPQNNIVGEPARIALIGGYSLYPLSEVLEHCLAVAGIEPVFYLGDFDNYVAEITDAKSELLAFTPDVICILPSARLVSPRGSISAAREAFDKEAHEVVQHLLNLCGTVHKSTNAEIRCTSRSE